MQSPFIVNDKSLVLARYPQAQINRTLQAWDSADELIIKHLHSNNLLADNKTIAIFNDNFGALSLSLLNHKVTSYSDSVISHLGITQNAQLNDLALDNLTLSDCTKNLPSAPDIVLLKIPKSLSLLALQLHLVSQVVSKQTIIIAGARVKDIQASSFKLFEQYIGTTTTSLAEKKARLVFCQPENNSNVQPPTAKQWSLEHTPYTISNLANVFARERLDIGARFILQHLPKYTDNSHIIDLGCGNGVLGLMSLTQNPSIHCHFVDESFFAIESAKKNIATNLPTLEQAKHCQFSVNDCLANVNSNSADYIICNPPFHQEHAMTDHIAWQMFKDSLRVLKTGAELRIVGNRQLAYHVKLKRLFGNCETIASNKKFVILSAIKR